MLLFQTPPSPTRRPSNVPQRQAPRHRRPAPTRAAAHDRGGHRLRRDVPCCGGHMEKCRMSALTDIFFPDLPRQFAAVKPDPSEAAIDATFDALDAVIARKIGRAPCRERGGQYG